MQRQLLHIRMMKFDWRGVLTIVNLLLLITLFYYLLNFHKNPSNNRTNISHRNNVLLEQEHFLERIFSKRKLSIGEANTRFLACITEPTPKEANPKVIADTRLSPKLDINFQYQLFSCMSLHIPIEMYELDAFKAINVEHKRFLPIDKAYYNDPAKGCSYLTMGIGDHTLAEEEFLQRYPKCKMYGIEILPENVGNFGKFGKVINVGIGFNESVTVLPEYTDYKGKKSYNLKLKTFEKILREDVGSTLIHYGTLDIDGFEYGVMERFEDFGEYESLGIVICQMDIEVHFMRDNLSTFLLEFFHKSSSYLPVYIGPYGAKGIAIKVTMINVKKPECELAFGFSKYFER